MAEQLETGGRAAPLLRRRDVGLIGLGNRGERVVGLEPLSKRFVESSDGFVGDGTHVRERIDGCRNSGFGDRTLGRRDMQKSTCVLHDHQTIASNERIGKLR